MTSFFFVLLIHISPCRVNEFGNGTARNPYSWNTAANIVFLDQVDIARQIHSCICYEKKKNKEIMKEDIKEKLYLKTYTWEACKCRLQLW